MGGSKFQKSIDPIGAWAHGRFQKSKPGKKGKGGGGGSTYDPMMEYMSQMQSNQAAQAEAARKAQEEAFIEAQKQSALAQARQGEMGAQQFLSQAGAMQQAVAAGESAIGSGYDISKARQEQLANLAGTGTMPTSAKLPFYGMADTTNAGAGATGRSANIFNLPKTSDIKFGGM
jgi:hypothetical protein